MINLTSNVIYKHKSNIIIFNKKVGKIVKIKKKYFNDIVKKNKILDTDIKILKEFGIFNNSHNDFILKDTEKKNNLFIELSSECNINCSYCYNKHISNKKIQIDDLIKFINKYFNKISLENQNEVNITFGGGEPILYWELIDSIITYLKNYKNIKFNYFMETNSLLLNAKIIKKIKENNIKLSISIDGLKYEHDINRIDYKGNGTFNKVENSLKLLLQNNIFPHLIMLTLNKSNIKLNIKKFLKFLKKYHCFNLSIQFNKFEIIHKNIDNVTQKLIEFVRRSRKLGINVFGEWLIPFLRLIDNEKSRYFMCSLITKDKTVIGTNKNFEYCPYFKQNKNLNLVIKMMENICKNCEINSVCYGVCPITLYQKNENITKYYCKIYKDFISKAVFELI